MTFGTRPSAVVHGLSHGVGAQSGAHEWAVVVLAGVFGLLVGSFLNVVVYRAPLGLSVSTPRSFCPTCDRQLAWWENVPVVSWVGLRGRCHTCHEPISVRYPLVELATSTTFVLVGWAWHGAPPTGGYCVLAATGIAIGLIEYGGQRSPLYVGAVGTLAGLTLIVVVATWFEQWAVVGWAVAGTLAGALVLAALRTADPECGDARWHGRTLLPVAGCWLGGIGGAGASHAVVAGGAALVLAEFACLVVVWMRRGHAGSPDDRPAGPELRILGRVAGTPLVTGILAALVVSLAIAG
jgi:leader peptidase (prepilin peptidase)/N-methyltransferase